MQAVGRPPGEPQVGDEHPQPALERRLEGEHVGRGRQRHLVARLGVAHERVEVLAEDLGSLDERHLGRHRPVGPDLEGQLVVVGLLTDPGLLDLVLDPGDRAEDGVEGNDSDLLGGLALLAGRHVAAAVLDDHLQLERHVVGEGREHEILVDDLDRLVGLHVGTGDGPLGALLDADHAGGVAVILDDQALDGQDDVGDVLLDALDGRELVERAGDLDLRDGAALQAGEQNPPQAVADGGAEAPLEGLRRELAVCAGQRAGIGDNRTGQLQTPPTNMHAMLLREPTWNTTR